MEVAKARTRSFFARLKAFCELGKMVPDRTQGCRSAALTRDPTCK